MPPIAGTEELITGQFLAWGKGIWHVEHPNAGAKGDGVTDDTVAIRAAHDAAVAAGGGTVLFSRKIYAVTADIDIDPNVEFRGVSEGGPRRAAGVTLAAGTVIKWTSGGAPVNAVLTCNLTNEHGQVRGMIVRGIRVDVNGQTNGARFLGLGPGCRLENFGIEQFSGTGLALTRSTAGVNVQGLVVQGLELAPMAGARGVTLSYTYASRFSDVRLRLALGETLAVARGIEFGEFVVGNTFSGLDLEDCDIPVDYGTAAGGGCVANTFIQVRAANPTVNPAAFTIGGYTGTVLFVVRTNATTNRIHSIIGLNDEEGFGRAFFDQNTGDFLAGGVGTRYPLVFGTTGPTTFQGALELKSTLAVTGVATFGNDVVLSTTAEFRRDVATSYLVVSGGTSAGDGGNILFTGGSHATQPAQIQFRGNASEYGRIAGGIFAWGTTVTAGADVGEIVLAQNKEIRYVDAAGTGTLSLAYGGGGNVHFGADTPATVHIGHGAGAVVLAGGAGGPVQIGDPATVAGAAAGEVVLASQKWHRSVDIAGTGTMALIRGTANGATNVVQVGDGTYAVAIGAPATLTSATGGELVMGNAKALRGVNAAGTSTLPMISMNASNATTLHCGTGSLAVADIATTASAGAVVEYLAVLVNGVSRRIAVYATS